jgi:hypothetical protein
MHQARAVRGSRTILVFRQRTCRDRRGPPAVPAVDPRQPSSSFPHFPAGTVSLAHGKRTQEG